jgi:hypothetical protein
LNWSGVSLLAQAKVKNLIGVMPQPIIMSRYCLFLRRLHDEVVAYAHINMALRGNGLLTEARATAIFLKKAATAQNEGGEQKEHQKYFTTHSLFYYIRSVILSCRSYMYNNINTNIITSAAKFIFI